MSSPISDSMDQILDRFDEAWNDPTPPRIHDYLAETNPDRRLALLIELVRIDLERRLTAGEKVRLEENYLPRFPELAAETPAVVTLVKHEFAVRRRNEPELLPREYLDRFPKCQTELLAQLPTLDDRRDADPQQKPADAPAGLDLRGYELTDALGKGGMGEVYRCVDPALGRDLAIKVMKAEDRSHPERERRFLREARVTGSLQHPGIVPIHNLGRLRDGRLHYTMRLVRGQTFADILKEEAGEAERLPNLLTIFEKICQAVAYAHSKQVIHRDLKPLNVMVGKFGEVQVMDWGLAKVLTADGAATDKGPGMLEGGTLIHTESDDAPGEITRAGTVIGTPPYMSPEQAQSDWELVDERTDVFALGSILCEILSGKPAYSGQDGSEVFRRAKRGDLADALRRLEKCGTDAMLTNLCLECLSYEREGRPRDAGVVAERTKLYQAEVQERLRRAELDRVEAEARAREEQTRLEAVEARTREALARLAVERRARRRLFALSSAVLITIATAFVLVRHSADQAIEAKNRAEELAADKDILAKAKSDLAEKETIARENAEKAQRLAKAEARKAQAVAKFLGGIFEASDPLGLTSQSIIFPHAAGEKLSGQDLLERGAEKCQRELKDQPDVQVAVLTAIGNAYVNLGEYEKGKPLLEKALRLAEEAEGKPQDIAIIKHYLGTLHHATGHYNTAEKLYRDALKLRKETQPVNELLVADTLFNLGWLLTDKEEHADAEKCYRQSLELRTKILGKKDRLVALCQAGLAAVFLDQNKNYPLALSLIFQSIQTFQQSTEMDSSLAKAIGLFQQGIFLLHSPKDVPLMSIFVANSREKGTKLLKESLQLVKESPLGKNHLIVALISGTLAMEFSQAQEDDRAKPYFDECLKIVEDRAGLWHPKLDKVAFGYAMLLIRQQKKQQADHFFQKILKAREDRFGRNHRWVANALVGYALIQDRFDPKCESMLVRARGIYQQAQPLNAPTSLQHYQWCLNQLGIIALDVHHKPLEAEKILRTARDRFQNCSSVPAIGMAFIQNNLAIALIQQSRYGEAEQLLKESRIICDKEGQNGQIALKANLSVLAQMYLRQHKYTDAEPLLRECLKVGKTKQSNDWETFNTLSLLGAACFGQKKYADAEPLLLRGYEGMKARESKIPSQFRKIRLSEALERLVQLYETTEQKEKAADWQKKLQETKVAQKKPKS